MKVLAFLVMAGLSIQVSMASPVSAICNNVGQYSKIEVSFDGNNSGDMNFKATNRNGEIEADQVQSGYRLIEKGEILTRADLLKVIRETRTSLEQVMYINEFTIAEDDFAGSTKIITIEGHYSRISTVMSVMGQTIRCR